MKPKVLLAGGTGYIGRYLSRVIEHDEIGRAHV